WLSLRPWSRARMRRWSPARNQDDLSTTLRDAVKRLSYSETKDMNIEAKFAGREVGYDVPAIPGMSEDESQTPCLILDLDALERNIRKMGDYARAHNMRHRAHGKMHKSV